MNQNLQKNLGLAPALSTVIGMVIGGGVFFKPQAVSSLTSGAPGLGMIAWVVAGIITITAGLTAAEVSAAIPKTGGMMVYIEEIYGKKLGVLTGWMQCVLFFPASIAALAVMFGSQSATLIGNESLVVPITLGTILLISILNTISSKTSGLIQTVATICKLIPLILIIVFGFINGGGTNSLTSPLVGPGISTGSVIGQLLIAILFAYDGWINVGALAGEMKNPGKDLPTAIVGGLTFVMAVYIIINIAYLWVLPANELANLKVGNSVEVVDPEDVEIGDYIVVKPGEKVPLDGVVVEGNSMVDTSALTGESVLRTVNKGDELLSGFINKNALLTVQVTKDFSESTVSKILDMVENASSKKSKTENFISVFSRYYTPVVVTLAALLSILPPLFMEGALFSDWLHRGLIFLVVSCPCALVLSIPLSYFSGIGVASKHGILIKGSNYLEALRYVDTVVFDKTGTLTEGVFDVVKVKTAGVSQDELMKFAAIAEANSNHPIAKSILKHYNKSVDLNKIEKYEEIAAHGIKVKYEKNTILAGNEKLMKANNIKFESNKEAGTVVYVAVDNKFIGYIVIADKIKKDSEQAIKDIKEQGIKQTVMLTGDNKEVATSVAKKLKLDKVFSNLLPNEKVDRIEELYVGRNEKEKIAFVGDGINDAPVLARVDVGIAMGGLGSDAAIEAADIVIMTDEPSKIAKGIQISKKTYKIVWQNIIFALGIKIIVMLFGAMGMASMWEAVFADVGVAILAVLNAMRIMK